MHLLHPEARPVTAATAVRGAYLALCAAAAAALTVLVALDWAPLLSFDRAVAGELHRSAVAEPGFTRLNRVLSDWVWDPWTMRVLTLGAAVWLWARRERLLAVWVAAASVLGTGVQHGLKWAVDRERPRWADPVDSADYAAFPSGHAMSAAVACGLLAWLLRREGVRGRPWAWCAAAAAVSVAGVGFTRLYLGVHWPSDVVGGWLLGALITGLAIASYAGAGRAVTRLRRMGPSGEDPGP
ncbi:phosphatase PAP2 family protein [Streptomyces sp. MUM 178J]|uniref:phosphatase PAP2 family protein n=1 Tax=Streptomyces sp. MUM 178J TaxID=2791991 RepID=UPI001F03DA05|nr:phosphatase PAP2 family protein [Streptomyces sp. MUM 178J]WRQ78232.1 phosphatase PAP2 family protein [Streptomyces sp. MUM 178J]